AIKLEVELANTANNLAFAQAEVGRSDVANRLAQSTLELRETLGPRSPVGLSLNTLAHIAIRDNLTVTARNRAERALSLFQVLEDKRGEGLALIALAESLRRRGEQKQDPELLRQAIERARQGLEIFAHRGAVDRQVEALIELGCAYRDLAKVLRGPILRPEDVNPDAKALADKGKQALKKAAEIAPRGEIAYRQVDALVNLAWLHYYIFEDQYILENPQSPLVQAESIVPKSYYITPVRVTSRGERRGGTPQLEREQAIFPFLAQMGKAQLLRGQIAFNRFEREEKKENLNEALEHYTLSLAYDTLFYEETFRDMRRAMDRIYERLNTLDPATLKIVYDIVESVEEKYGLEESRMTRFLRESFGSREMLVPVEL
ncbi:MAG: hypothetical protein DRI77_13255, partial [Chloroflexi bacterium]